MQKIKLMPGSFQFKTMEWVFDPKYKQEIFALYKHLNSKNNYHGSGIGLATCYRAIKIHGGDIGAESEPGKGSTFFLTIPK